MASCSKSQLFLLYAIFLLLLHLHHTTAAATTAPQSQLLLPILKDDAKLQYYTTFLVGTPSVRVNLVIDLGNLFSWFTCDMCGYTASSTYHPISCDAVKCSTYGGASCVGCNMAAKPSCNNNTCGGSAYTPWSQFLYSVGLIEDTIALRGRTAAGNTSVQLPKFPFMCADKGPLKGISQHTKGVLTLAQTPVALHSRISAAFKVPHKFAVCIPSSSSVFAGGIIFGGGAYSFPPSKLDLSKNLVFTPIVTNPNSTAPIYTVGEPSIEYFIKVRSIKVDGTPVRFNSSLLSFDKDGNGGTKISTLTAYTTLHSEIYSAVVAVFVGKAEAMKIRRVAAVAPFGACFSRRSIAYNGRTGTGVPIIDLVMENKSPLLHNKNARWRIYGANSMVEVSTDVSCLAFVDGGSDVRTAVVVGGLQMEDNLVEFDLVSSELGISSSLLRFGTSCSQFKGI